MGIDDNSIIVTVLVTLKLAFVSTSILMILSTAIAWWLSQTSSRLKSFIEVFVSLPLVLPPTVLGFYLLLAMGPDGVIGKFTNFLGIGYLPFTFWGLVIGSVFYSLPIVVRPIQNSFEAIGKRPLEVAATLKAGPWDTFFSVVLPMSKSGLISGAILGFAHTIGEFGVVLMIGGNIPGVTKVISVHIFEQVEALEYSKAHQLSSGMLAFSFLTLLLIYLINRKKKGRLY